MACMKLGSKTDAFQKQGQAWFCTTGLPSDITIEVGEMSFHLHKVVLRNWKDCLKALQTCDDVAAHAEELTVTKRCIESLAMKAGTDSSLFGWPVVEHEGPMQSPGGSVLWNGINTGSRPKNSITDWWIPHLLCQKVPTSVESSSGSQ